MKKKLITILIIFLIALPTISPFFNTKFFYTQDHIFIARLHQLSTALSDGHFPVRWASDLRYGEPIFNYYASLPYYIGALIHLLGFNFIWVAKILFVLSALISAVTMYFLGRELFGKKAGFLAAILYTYAPYRAVDMYIRGALSETWAFVFFPLIFYTSLLVSKKRSFLNASFLALSLAGLFLTHNVTTLMFLPFLVLWWIYLVIKEQQWKIILFLVLAAILGIGLAAFFLLPAISESNFIQTKYLTVGYFDFRAHFVAYKQLFSLFWGYGSSLWGPKDELSFQVGLINWVIVGLAALIGIINRLDKKTFGILSILAISFILSIFLQHNKSVFIWEAFPVMAFIQFPWRFLGISIFIISIVGAAITPYLKNKLSVVYFVLVITAITSTLMYFKPKEYVDDAFFDKFLNKEKMRQGVDLTKDYLPIWVKTVDAPQLNYPENLEGQMEVSKFEKKTANAQSEMNVLRDSMIEVPIAYFPGWIVVANNRVVNLETPLERGLIRFKLPKGVYNVNFEFKDTPVRMMGNIISLISLIILIFLFKIAYKNV